MFTGIIRHTGTIVQLSKAGEGKRLTVETESALTAKLEKGITSVAIDGACHTVEDFKEGRFTVYSSFETVKKTTVSALKTGSQVNLELPLTPQTLLDGHLVQGHVDGVGRLLSIQKHGEAFLYRFGADHGILQYLVEKDSITVDGISLTLFQIDDSSFQVAVIPETIAKTTLSHKKAGKEVNLEVNIFAKYSYRFSKIRSDRVQSLVQDW